ncbi:hypothetical protein [Thermosynechococcus sp.]|uniref:hypothetical protein n=1 Tax=Thermosynechococcus sp. TaxID=2814275 RepID=UPI00391BB64F
MRTFNLLAIAQIKLRTHPCDMETAGTRAENVLQNLLKVCSVERLPPRQFYQDAVEAL